MLFYFVVFCFVSFLQMWTNNQFDSWTWLGYVRLWCLTLFSAIFQLYHSGQWGNCSTQRKPPTCSKSLTTFITWCCIEHTSSCMGFEPTMPMIISQVDPQTMKDHHDHIYFCLSLFLTVWRPSLTVNILIFSAEATGPIWTHSTLYQIGLNSI